MDSGQREIGRNGLKNDTVSSCEYKNSITGGVRPIMFFLFLHVCVRTCVFVRVFVRARMCVAVCVLSIYESPLLCRSPSLCQMPICITIPVPKSASLISLYCSSDQLGGFDVLINDMIPKEIFWGI